MRFELISQQMGCHLIHDVLGLLPQEEQDCAGADVVQVLLQLVVSENVAVGCDEDIRAVLHEDQKLRMLATSEIQADKRVRFLKLLETLRITREKYLIPTREADFKGWLMREIILDKVESMASSLLESLLESMEEPPVMPNDPTLQKYLDGVKLEARKHMFQSLRSKDAKGDIKSIKGSALHGDPKASDTSLAKEVVKYIHGGSSKIEPYKVAGVSSIFGCCVGDYIEMDTDFEKGQRNEAYGMVGINIGEDLPDWDVLTEDHVRYGISIVAASLDDVGWLVMISPLQGPCLSWIEKHAYCRDLMIARRVVIGSKIPYGGYIQMENTHSVRVHCSILLFAHRMSYSPSLFIENSKGLFKAYSLRNEEDLWAHYMPESKKTQHPCTSRLPHYHMLQMILGYTCFAFDNDATIFKDMVEPAMLSRQKRRSGSKATDCKGGEEEFVAKPLRDPFMEDD
ncbi:hypothetical protein L7F22_045442 [Adiantum nelumboides]|nr:hypothetical protein [Adiantum nelumboides]